MKAARRAERSLAKRAGTETPAETQNDFETVPTESEPQS